VVKRKKDRMEPEDLQDEIEAALEETTEVPQAEVPDTSFDEVVNQAIRGEWGKGQDRRLRLSQAGYDHVAVQKEIIRRTNAK